MACKKTRNEEYSGGFPPGMGAFEMLTDPCKGKANRHHFGEILFIALAAMIGGMEGFDDIERFAKLKETWLRRILKLPHGTLHAEVTALFADHEALEYGKTKGNQVRHHDPGPEKSHSRIEQRVVKASDYLDGFEPAERKHGLGLRSLVEITRPRKLRLALCPRILPGRIG
jgi:DDE_Tnp_1-associated